MKSIVIQISHRLTAPINPVLAYYSRKYKTVQGYHIASDDYLEIPAWIAEVCGRVHIDELVVIRSDADMHTLFARDDIECIYGSVMDVNVKYWTEIVRNVSVPVILGGYVDKALFANASNVAWLDSVSELGPGKPDYHLFEGMRTIPRLQLSKGCFYECKFCTIEKGVRENELSYIHEQVESFKALRFELIYIDDKTFGQARNWTALLPIYEQVKAYNPSFRGFIVQSAIPEIMKHAYEWTNTYHVKVIECGVETRDEWTLTAWNKKHAIPDVLRSSLSLQLAIMRGDVQFIPNIIFGIAGDARGKHAYSNTLAWLHRNRRMIAWINPYLLCEYRDGAQADVDENDIHKSWLSIDEQGRAIKAFNIALKF